MSGGREDLLLIDDLIDAGGRLVELGASSASSPFGSDRDRDEAILFNLIVLGEAAKRLTPRSRETWPGVPWSLLAQTRDCVVHHCEGVDWEAVGIILCDEMPALLPQLRAIRSELEAGGSASD
jgi:uncharacterized protein with HEPN domain